MKKITITWPGTAAVAQPVRIPIPPVTANGGPLQLVESTSGQSIPVQREGDTTGVALVLPTAGPHTYSLEAGVAATAVSTQLRGLDELEIRVGGELFSIYHCSRDLARPFLHPVLLPGGVAVTRNFPMKDVEGETRDHPHHRSLWTAYGEVNDTDNWSEAVGKHGRIQHAAFDHVYEGPVFGGFDASASWTDVTGVPLMKEKRRILVYNAGGDRRLLDYELTLTPVEREIVYGDTKEGGLLSFRVATAMDGKSGGRIENSEGGVGEKECWGRPARWCDYSGQVSGQTVGIAVLDHPSNLRSPVHWHVRDYGLMGTNCFGDSTFAGEKNGHRGEYRQAQDETLQFRYRVLLHQGDARAARVEETWRAYANPPKVEE
jgi:Family of unknown function (DUF6807)